MHKDHSALLAATTAIPLNSGMETKINKYTCREYRAEMILLGLNRQLNQDDLPEDEKQVLREEINKLKSEMDMD